MFLMTLLKLLMAFRTFTFGPIISYGYIYERLIFITEVYNSRCSFVRYIFVFSKNNFIYSISIDKYQQNVLMCHKAVNQSTP